MFFDDIMILGPGSDTEWCVISDILKNFYEVLGLTINQNKYQLLLNEATHQHKVEMVCLLHVRSYPLEEGTRYLGYFINPHGYNSGDSLWLLQIFDRRIKIWCWRWLSLGGRLTLAQSVLVNLVVY